MKNIYLLLLALTLPACGGDSEDKYHDISELILQNQSIWHDSGISDYTYTYREIGYDCNDSGDQFSVKRVITVEDNVIVSVYSPEINYYEPEVTFKSWRTIDDVFDLMLETNINKPKLFSESEKSKGNPLFNEVYGFPVSFFIDLTSKSCDSKKYLITEFK